jgi:hypothetical protein
VKDFPDYMDVIVTVLFVTWIITSIIYGLIHFGWYLRGNP